MCLCGSHSITLALLAFTTPNMPLELSELSSDTEFPELVYVEWASFEKPCCKLIRLYFPVHGDGPEARAAALKESTERQIGWHRSDPTSHWIKIPTPGPLPALHIGISMKRIRMPPCPTTSAHGFLPERTGKSQIS